MKKRIAIIGSVGVPSRYGGFETLSEELCLNMGLKYEIHVFCSTKHYSNTERQTNWNNITRTFLPLSPNGFSSIFYDIFSIIKSSRKSDTLLILGGSGTIILPAIRLLFPKLHLIFHPDGLEWKRQKWNILIKWYLWISIRIGCHFSHKIVIDNKALLKYYSKYSNKTEIITYGGNFTANNSLGKKNYWLTIARAEKENNLSIIAKAFIDEPKENWTLLSNCKKTKFGRKFLKEYSSYKNIRIIDANYNRKYINDRLSECKGYIHGHSTGGTNPSLVTAIWSGKKILCHNNSFNKETTNNLVEYFIDQNELRNQITVNNVPNSELYELAPKIYSWKNICNQYDKLFESC